MSNRYRKKADWTMPSAVEVKLNACYMRTLGKSMGKKKRESMWLVEIIEGFQDALGSRFCRTLRALLTDIVLIIICIRSYFY